MATKRAMKTAQPRWSIITEVIYKGITYSRGSKIPPEATEAEIARWVAERRVAEHTPEGQLIELAPLSTPTRIEDYLRGNDMFCLRAIRMKGSKQIAEEVLKSATAHKRSQVLIEALKLYLAVPLTIKEQRLDGIRRSA